MCDWAQAGPGQQALAGTWQSFGPDRRIKPRKRKLKLSAQSRHPRRGSKAKLAAKLSPCPDVRWQEIRLERRRKGEWKRVESEPADGGSCKAQFRLRVRGNVQLRATVKSSEGFAGAHSKRIKLKPRV